MGRNMFLSLLMPSLFFSQQSPAFTWLPGQEYYNFNIWLNLVLLLLFLNFIMLLAILLRIGEIVRELKAWKSSSKAGERHA